MTYEPATGSTVFATPDSEARICCVRSAMRADSSVGSASASSRRVAVQRLRAAEHRRERLDGDADDVVVRLLRRQRAPGGLGMEAQLLRPRIRRAEALAA